MDFNFNANDIGVSPIFGTNKIFESIDVVPSVLMRTPSASFAKESRITNPLGVYEIVLSSVEKILKIENLEGHFDSNQGRHFVSIKEDATLDVSAITTTGTHRLAIEITFNDTDTINNTYPLTAISFRIEPITATLATYAYELATLEIAATIHTIKTADVIPQEPKIESIEIIKQTGHGFTAGKFIKQSTTQSGVNPDGSPRYLWELTMAEATGGFFGEITGISDNLGVVTKRISADSFIVAKKGSYIENLPNTSIGDTLYATITLGDITTTKPTAYASFKIGEVGSKFTLLTMNKEALYSRGIVVIERSSNPGIYLQDGTAQHLGGYIGYRTDDNSMTMIVYAADRAAVTGHFSVRQGSLDSHLGIVAHEKIHSNKTLFSGSTQTYTITKSGVYMVRSNLSAAYYVTIGWIKGTISLAEAPSYKVKIDSAGVLRFYSRFSDGSTFSINIVKVAYLSTADTKEID